MAGGFGDGFYFEKHVHHFPDGDTMTQHVGFTPTGSVAKANARVLLFQSFFLQIKAAQGGYLQMTAFRLAG